MLPPSAVQQLPQLSQRQHKTNIQRCQPPFPFRPNQGQHPRMPRTPSSPPFTTMRPLCPSHAPNPDGSVYSDLVSSVPTTIFDHAEPANINTIRRPFRPQQDIGSLSTPPSDHTALQSQVRNLWTQLAAAEASFRSPVDPSTSIIEGPSADDPSERVIFQVWP
jgi:hypothetical protein